MDDPKNTAALKRALLFGPLVSLLLLLAALVMYGVLGFIGWEGSGRILAALCSGPILGFAISGALWIAYKARLTT